MQAGGQCGVSEVHQFMVGRSAGSGGHAHMFSHSGHDVAAVTPSSHSHSHHSQQQQQHHQQNHQSQHHQQQQMLQQQQQQRHQRGLDPDSPKLPSPAVAARQSPNSNYIKPLVITRDSLAADDEGMEEGDRSIGGNRWPRQETLALIKIRTDMDASFRDASLKGPLWEDVSRKLEELGFHRSAKKCKEKFENVHKYYKKTKEGKGGRQDGKSYRFFSQLEALYGGSHGGGGGGSMQATSKGAGGNSSRAPKAAAGDVGGSAQIFSDQIMDEFNVSSESWEDHEYEDPEDELPESKKRKRKASTWTSCSYEVAAFEGLVRKMMEKQEVMQRKLLEVIDRREHERVMRENAWRRQEMARISREQELRAQERSRAASMDAALVTFLQKVTGQTLHLPHCIPTPPPATATAPAGSHDAPPPHHPSASKHEEAAAQFDDDPQDKEAHMDPNSNRWPRSEVLSLIRLRSGMEAKFQESGPKAPLWEAISAAMASLGYNRSTKRCKEKWENINKYFRKTKESSKKRPENAKTCPYFHQLDALYKTGVLNSPTGKQAPKLELDQTNEMLDRHDHTARKDSGQAQAEEEMLALIPSSAEDAPPNEVAVNGTSSAAPALSIMFTAQEDGSVVDRSVNTASTTKMNEKQSDIDDGRPTGSGGMSFDQRFPGHHEKPLKQLEGLVKEMMEQHHQQQQQSSDEFELSVDDQTQAENKSHDDHDQWQQQQDNFKLRSSAHDQARSNPKDAALIALVHKLAGQAPEHFPSISDLST